MRTMSVKVYKFEELSEDVKEKVKQKYYENETYDFLTEGLTEDCKRILEEKEITFCDDLTLFYSLGHSQGDGLCFVGNFTKGGLDIGITHSGRYHNHHSVIFIFSDKKTGEYVDDDKDFIQMYRNICDDLESNGYDILDYRMDDQEFNENSESNDYEYYEDGRLV